jgi:glyoxylase-like metal-dependent hydrolase (beta-lactamase superfamily II)
MKKSKKIWQRYCVLLYFILSIIYPLSSSGAPVSELSNQVKVWKAPEKWYRAGRERNVTCFDIEDKIILIDPGAEWWEKSLLEEFPRIDEIWLTHGHIDHVAIASKLQNSLGSRILSSEQTKKIVQNPSVFMDKEYKTAGEFKNEIFPWLLQPLDGIIKRISYGSWPPSQVDDTFENLGESLYGARLVSLPGHTKGSYGFYLDDGNTRIMVIGDLLQKRTGGVVVSLNLPSVDLDLCLSSIQKVKEIKPDILVAGHGEIMEGAENIETLIDETSSKYNKYRKEIFNYIVKEHSISSLSKIADEVPFSWPPNYTAVFFEKRSLVLAVLKSLYKNNKLDPSLKGIEKLESVLD